MVGKVFDIQAAFTPDNIAREVAMKWHTWNSLRAEHLQLTTEIRQYAFATDTRKTSNSKLPWKNTTTIPKMCQIRDNLRANYLASIFPKRKFLRWDADDKSSNTQNKRKAITGYMCYAIDRKEFKDEMAKCVDDYIDHGNAFVMPEWVDQRVQVQDKSGKVQAGYVGPGLRRINPVDIVFNPIADSWDRTPKIVRSLVSLGEVKELLESMSNDDNRKAYEALFQEMLEYRKALINASGELTFKDTALNVDGFSNYRLYLESDVAEVLTFYGDMYSRESDEFLKNHIIMVVDRRKVISMKPNPSLFGTCPIRHVGWRTRADNLWAMSPLANIVGMQYRIDHIENAKSDVLDLIVFPPLKIKGFVQDFDWGPFAKIIMDEEGDVEVMQVPYQVLQTNQEIGQLMAWMEELTGSPKEAMGFRTPGEKTKYEVQRLENAAARIFQAKVTQFEEQFVEPALNDMLELARRKVTSDILAKYFDDELKITKFLELSPTDINGEGRIRPFAARHFAEQAELVQNLTNLFQSPIGQDPGFKAHWSTIKSARLFEDLFDITDYGIVSPYVRMAEEADAQRLANAQQEQVYMEAMESAGLTPDDTAGAPPGPPGMPPQGGPPDASQAPQMTGQPPQGAGQPTPFQSGPGFGPSQTAGYQ